MTSTQIIALVFAVVVVVVVSVFLKKTATGTAMRAIANDRDVSSLLGVPIRRVEALAWLGSGVICGCVFLLLPPLFKSIDQGTLTWFVIGALGGAIVGQFRSLPITFFASLVIGVIEAVLTPFYGEPPVPGRLPKDDAVRGLGRRDRVDQPQAHCRAVRQGDAMTTVATSASAATPAPNAPVRCSSDVATVCSSRSRSSSCCSSPCSPSPAFLDSFWIANFTQMAVFSIVARQRRPAVRACRLGVARSGCVVRHRLLGDHASGLRHLLAVSRCC